jgi:hypothetical protein
MKRSGVIEFVFVRLPLKTETEYACQDGQKEITDVKLSHFGAKARGKSFKF